MIISIAFLQTEDFWDAFRPSSIGHVVTEHPATSYEDEKFEFCIYYVGGPTNSLILNGIGYGFVFLLNTPIMVITVSLLSGFASILPTVYQEYGEVLTIFTFFYFSVNYWLLLSYILYQIHDIYSDKNPNEFRVESVFAKPY